ncbi:MAG: putative quinol monooxygenase [Thermoleophilia bacterium]
MAVVVTSRWTIREGEVDAVLAAVRELVRITRDEPGVLLLEAHRDPADPRIVFFYEQFADEAAIEAHTRTEHFQRLLVEQCLPRVESRERGRYVTWDA